jgi:hypothetical protein
MRAVQALAAIGLLSSLPSTAFADWGYTKWEMRPEEVIAASGGRAVAYTERDRDLPAFYLRAEATAPHTWRGFEFTAYFLFDRLTEGLHRVALVLKAPQKCPDLAATLNRLHGMPDIEAVKPTHELRTWPDKPGNANLNLFFLKPEPPECKLMVIRPVKLQ